MVDWTREIMAGADIGYIPVLLPPPIHPVHPLSVFQRSIKTERSTRVVTQTVFRLLYWAVKSSRTNFSFRGGFLAVLVPFHCNTVVYAFSQPSENRWSDGRDNLDRFRGYVQSYTRWNAFLSIAEFNINNSVHVSPGIHRSSWMTHIIHAFPHLQCEGLV